MNRTPRRRRVRALLAMGLSIPGLLGFDLWLFFRSESATRIARGELNELFGPAVTLRRAAVALDGGIHLYDLRFRPGGREIMAAREARIVLDVLRGRPLSVQLSGLDMTLDPERLEAFQQWVPPERVSRTGEEYGLPVVRLDEGCVTVRGFGVLRRGTEVVFDLRDGELVQRPGAPMRAYLEIHNRLLGDWDLRWTSSGTGHEAVFSTNRFVFTPELAELLSERVRREVEKVNPQGPAAIEVRVRTGREGGGVDVRARVKPEGMALQHERFPYRLSDCVGEVEFTRDGVLVKYLRGRTTGGTAFLSGEVRGYEYAGSVDFDLRIDRVKVDDRLRAAAGEDLRKWLDRFAVEGCVGVYGKIVKAPGEDEKFRIPLRVVLQDCRARFDRFPYPLEHVNGTFVLDGDDVRIDRISSVANGARVEVVGDLHTGVNAESLDLRILARNLRLDETLRTAIRGLSGRARETYDSFSPHGLANVEWRLLQRPGEDLEHRFVLELRGVGAVFRDVPVPVEGLRGTARGVLRSDGIEVRWDSIRGRYHSSDIRLNGELEGERIRVELQAVGLPVQEDLVQHLPETIRKTIRQLGIQGRANLRTDYRRASNGGPSEFTVEVRLSGASFDLEVPVREVEGKVYLVGRSGPPSGDVTLMGRIDFSHARVQGKRFSRVTGSLTLQHDQLTLSNLLGTAYDGVVSGRLWVNLKTREFRAGVNMAGINLRQMRQDTEGYRSKNLGGRLSISIPDVRGTFGKPETIRGSGELTIREGELWSVPFFLKILTLNPLRLGRDTTFTAGVVKFTIRDRRFGFDSMIFRSEDVSLVGQGWLDFDWRIKVILKVQTEPLGDFWLFAPVNVILNIFTSNFTAIQVKGPFENPEVEWKPFRSRPRD